ncbi:MAG TPA: ferredoxin:thioredoxin reductase [bacterium (Candidatus Stahlbacteria)]|nr:ferredoxin:thioredoxin reductase [Candidatus Stahlbacteria bacterium]
MFEKDDAYKENYKRLAKIAAEKGYIFNPDKERVNKVIGLMTNNFREFGKYYCPCKQSHPLDPNKDPICPCVELDEEVARDGQCYCRLFFKGSE